MCKYVSDLALRCDFSKILFPLFVGLFGLDIYFVCLSLLVLILLKQISSSSFDVCIFSVVLWVATDPASYEVGNEREYLCGRFMARNVNSLFPTFLLSGVFRELPSTSSSSSSSSNSASSSQASSHAVIRSFARSFVTIPVGTGTSTHNLSV